MKIIISEEQKKKLFVPRDIDSRYEKWGKEVEKFLLSIKKSIVWNYCSRIETSYDYVDNHEQIDYYDKKGNWSSMLTLKNLIQGDNNDLYDTFKSDLKKITDHMGTLTEMTGEDENVEILEIWNTIECNDDNTLLTFNQGKRIEVNKPILKLSI